MKIKDNRPEFVLSAEEMFAFAKLFGKESDIGLKAKGMTDVEEAFMGRVYTSVQARYGNTEKRDKLLASYHQRAEQDAKVKQ